MIINNVTYYLPLLSNFHFIDISLHRINMHIYSAYTYTYVSMYVHNYICVVCNAHTYVCMHVYMYVCICGMLCMYNNNEYIYVMYIHKLR